LFGENLYGSFQNLQVFIRIALHDEFHWPPVGIFQREL
jgi:hypothetical protein